MGGTLVAAVALSLASSGLLILDAREAENWVPLLAECLYCTVVSTFATLPCLWAGMIAKNKETATGIIAIYTLLMSLLFVVILGLLPSGTMPGEVAMMFFAVHVSLMAVILGTLHVARLCGYKFIRRSRRHPDLQTDCPSALQDDPSDGAQAAETPGPGADDPPDSAGPSA